MTTYQRMKRTYRHQDVDRVPIWDYPWASTLDRWRREGLAEGDFRELFDLDRIQTFQVDNSPRYPERTLEETETYQVVTTPWGATLKQWKHVTSTPEFLDFTIKDKVSWEAARARMVPSADRLRAPELRRHYPAWRRGDDWVVFQGWFGFDITHSWVVGTETLLMALLEDPEWCRDMFGHQLEVQISLYDKLWDEGYHFDSFFWWDDLGYKQHQFFSMDTYREVLKPVHQRAIDWVHSKGAIAHLHSCGDIRPFVPELVSMGLDALNPLEVKAGMDPVALKQEWGDRLTLHGGVDAVLWTDPARLIEAIRRDLPVLRQKGGYIFATDHSIPDSVSLEDFRAVLAEVRR